MMKTVPPFPRGTIIPVIIGYEPANEAVPSYLLSEVLEEASAWFAHELGNGGFKSVVVPIKFTVNSALEQELEITYRQPPLGTGNPGELLSRYLKKQNYPDYTTEPYLYVALGQGLGGYAGTVHNADQVGISILGDACIYALEGKSARAEAILGWAHGPGTTRNGQIGALIHEMVHGLGWGTQYQFNDAHQAIPVADSGHDQVKGSIMGDWSAYPDVHLLPVHKWFLRTMEKDYWVPLPWWRLLWDRLTGR